jgi:glycine betaine/proline transport system ATP-binding protein
MEKLRIENLYKIFGRNTRQAFGLLDKKATKEEILDKTGCTVGIDNASFTVNQGETFVVMGLSGSGKSTVIRCLNRLIRPTKGTILLDGENILKMNRQQLLEVRRKKLSMVFQHFGLLPQRTVLGNVEFGLEISGVDKVEREKKAREALELVGLKGYEDQKPDELSGGMQQRVGLARALANDPEILLMDEAFSALDPLIRSQMQDELLELQARMHKTIIFITHDLDEALKIGDRIVIMKDGKVVQIGTPEEILTQPADDYVKAFVQNVDRTKVITAGSIMHKAQSITIPKDGPRVAVRLMEKHGVSSVYVVNHERELMGILTIDHALELERKGSSDVASRVSPDDVYVCNMQTPLCDLLGRAMTARYPVAIQDDNNRFCGIVDRATILAEVYETPENDSGTMTLVQTLDERSSAE